MIEESIEMDDTPGQVPRPKTGVQANRLSDLTKNRLAGMVARDVHLSETILNFFP
jgi:hypothetical protein